MLLEKKHNENENRMHVGIDLEMCPACFTNQPSYIQNKQANGKKYQLSYDP